MEMMPRQQNLIEQLERELIDTQDEIFESETELNLLLSRKGNQEKDIYFKEFGDMYGRYPNLTEMQSYLSIKFDRIKDLRLIIKNLKLRIKEIRKKINTLKFDLIPMGGGRGKTIPLKSKRKVLN